MFPSLCRNRQPRRFRVSLLRHKAFLLACLGLIMLVPRPAQAQALPSGWTAVPCDATGNTSGITGFQGTQSGTINRSSTYKDIYNFIASDPSYFDDGSYDTAASYLLDPTYLDDGSTVATGSIGVETNSDYGSEEGMWARNFDYDQGITDGFLSAPGYNSEAINGSQATTVSGSLNVYYKCVWQGSGPQPAYPTSMSLLTAITLIATGDVDYANSGVTSGLTATANASDSLGDSLSASVSSPTDASPPPLTKYYLVQAPIDSGTGIATTGFSGTAQMTVNNTLPYSDAPAGRGSYTHQTVVNANALVTATAVPTSASLQAHSTVDTSAPGNPWDPTHPRFFSGTNCSANGTAVAASGYILHAELLVGGTDVKDYYDTSFYGPFAQGVATGTNQNSTLLTVHFDSTHFADASNVPVQLTVTDTNSNTYNIMVQASTYNEGYVGYEPTTVSGQSNAQVVAAAMSACQTGDNNSSTTDNRDAVLSAVKFNTDFFTCSHGNETPDASNHIYFEPPAGVGNSNGVLYGNQSFDPSSTAQNPRNDVAEAVASKSVNPPPYNFVYLDVCNGGLNIDFANGFGISASSTDQAFIGWAGVVADNSVNLQWTGRLYNALASGETLQASIATADTADPTHNVPLDLNTNSPCPRPVTGDLNMTLHGTVYQGTTGSWFK